MHWIGPTLLLIAHVGLILFLVTVILLRRGGTSDARLAWIVFIVLAPFLGAIAYVFLGGARIAGRRRRRHAHIHSAYALSRGESAQYLQDSHADIPEPYDRVFSLAGAVSETDVLGGNSLELVGRPGDFADRIERDIDEATESVHMLSYIYLDDEVGRRIGQALMRARGRGVAVRLQVDSVGSRCFLKSGLRREIEHSGVLVAEMLPARLLRAAFSRMDIRNHRKIAIIDNAIAWVGSRNIASPDFAPKAKFAPWVDCMVVVRGPAVCDLQCLFLEDWEVNTGESHEDYLHAAAPEIDGTACCQVVGTGPNFNNEALTQVLHACFHAAKEELVLTTPYYVPDAATEAALRAAALRGVHTTLIVPAHNDSRLVALASRSHYASLIGAGVEIQEYQAGLLHAKTMTVDHDLFMVGSANLDRRSLELNFEVSMFGWCPDFASRLHFLQMSYLNDCRPVDSARWLRQPAPSRLLYNLAGLLSPLL
jgi:cardiolipin synthase